MHITVRFIYMQAHFLPQTLTLFFTFLRKDLGINLFDSF